MSLSVKDPEAYRLAKSIARVTGESMTSVVISALREREAQLNRHEGKATAEELLAIGKRFSDGLEQPYLDHAELLYDEHGLPK